MRDILASIIAGLSLTQAVTNLVATGPPVLRVAFARFPELARVVGTGPALELLNQVDADVITFEMKSSNAIDLEAVGQTITGKKVCIGVVDHHTLQVESPEEVADVIRRALKVIPVERLVISTDCGMGREGMSRRHAFYKMVSIVRGVNLVRRELGIPESPCLAADPKYSLL